MNRARTILALGASAVILTLAACERPSAPGEAASGAPAAAAFSHAMEDDLSGFYMPVGEVRSGRWRLDHVFVGQAVDFAAWEAGRREGAFAPVMLEFVDDESPLVATELGEVRSGRPRVLPTAYEVTDEAVRFGGRAEGLAEGLGEVMFEGRLDPDALGVSRRNLGDEGVVLAGTLTIDGRAQRVSLRWWAGD